MQWDSLIDYRVPNQAAALNAGPFTNVQSANYWSATEVAGTTTNAWFVSLLDGNVGLTDKDCGNRVWCVRRGKEAHADW